MTHRAPDFIIVGAQKAGTTSLYNCIRQHPQVLAASKKEIHYFSRFYNKPLNWYLEHFPERDDQVLSGEASPFYLLHPQSANRIAQAYPQIKIIILLRDPVQRAISHYHQQYRRGHETLPMMEAFKKESQRTEHAWQNLLANKQLSGSALQKFSYLKRGEYIHQIKRYETCFPADQILVLESQDFFGHPYDMLSLTYGFLGIDPDFKPEDLWPRKPGGYEEADSEILSFLQQYYAPFNSQLFEHLGKKFNWS